MSVWLSEKRNSSSMTPCLFQIPTVHMLMANFLLVGGMKTPLPSGIGRVKVPG